MNGLPPKKQKGIVNLREAGTVAVRLRFTGGAATADQFAAIADIAQRYSGGRVHLTTRQGIEIAPVAVERATELIAAMEAQGIPVAALGAVVRAVTACPGMICRNGIIDAQGLSQRIDEAFRDFQGAHAKIKIAVAGCPNGCTKPAEHDLGICGVASITIHAEGCTGCGACAERCKVGAIAVEETTVRMDENRCILCGGCALVCPSGTITLDKEGFRLFAGGKMGRFPRLGRTAIPRLDDVEEVVAAMAELLETYRVVGRKGERLGETFTRVGWPDETAMIGGRGRPPRT
jgi:dissimilatory sulfite reductase (desulfoviridin) alpha/beta subunit